MYLTHNRKNSAGDSLSHRLGCGMEYASATELAKSVSGYTGIMELQPSQINWGKFNAMPMPGAVRMWVWHAFGMGERFVCTYRFRQPLFGIEQFHHGIMQTDGVSVSHGGKDFVKAVDEINQLEKHLDPSAESEFVNRSRTGFAVEQPQRDRCRTLPPPSGLGYLAAHLHLLSGAQAHGGGRGVCGRRG